jgi:MFS family permease
MIFGILAVAYVLAFFQRMAPATVAMDIMSDLKTGEGMMGVLTAAYFYPHALMQMPAGVLSDRWGAKRTIGAFFLVAAFGSVLFAWSESLFSASLGRFLVGAGMAMLFVPALKIFSMWFQGKEFASVTGLFVSAGGIGSLLATTPLAVLTEWLGWRASFVCAGIFTLLIAVAALFLISDKPPTDGTSSGHPQDMEQARDSMRQSFLLILKQRSFWPLATWFFFGNGLFFTFAGLWAGPYLEEIYRLGKTEAGNILSMVAVGIVVGGALLSMLSNRVFRARKPVMLLSAAVIMALFGLMAIFVDSLPIPALFAIFLLLGVFGNGVVAIGFTVAKETFPLHLSGTVLGMVNVCGFLGPAVLQPLIGYLLERHGDIPAAERYGYVLLALLGCSCITVVAAMVVSDRGNEFGRGRAGLASGKG